MKPTLDFSILDEEQLTVNSTATLNEAGQCKPVQVAQNAPQAPPVVLQGIQQLKIDISHGIKSGADPYPLLLKAIEIIATTTNDREYYSVHRDVMQGMGMLEQIPAEWEQDCVKSNLQKLKDSRQNIDAAITAHKQRLDGQPINGAEDADKEYNLRIKKCFRVAYEFLDGYKCASTLEDFTAISRALGKIGSETNDPLLAALLVAAFDELEREYINESGK